jgi:hypothetical protein
MAQQYIREADRILLVADINRAISNEGMRAFLEEYSEQLVLDGKLQQIACIATCGDDMDFDAERRKVRAKASRTGSIRDSPTAAGEREDKEFALIRYEDVNRKLKTITSAIMESAEIPDSLATVVDIPVFCVSSLEYQRIVHRNKPGKVFSCPEETGIPAVQVFVRAEGIQFRMTVLHRCCRELMDKLEFVKYSLENTPPTQQDAFKQQVSVLQKEVRSAIQSFRIKMDGEIQQVVDSVKAGTSNAAAKYPMACKKWAPYMYQTFQAIIKNEGRFINRQGKKYDMNRDLADPVFWAVTSIWHSAFNVNIQMRYFSDFERAFNIAFEKFKNGLVSISERLQPAANVVHCKLISSIQACRDEVLESQRAIHQIINDKVHEHSALNS